MDKDFRAIRRALLSVSDKTGIVEFARFLAEAGIELISTGGTAKTLRQAGLKVLDVSEVTGFPEIMDGRVKTLHPAIHGGILGRADNRDHCEAQQRHNIQPIDLVVVNLYPFEETLRAGADIPTIIENIDIGGPALIRASAKNHDFVVIITEPSDYETVQHEMSAHHGATNLALRKRLAAKAYAHTASYDSAIARWMAAKEGDLFPDRLTIAGKRRQSLRYGENPHQRAAFYASDKAAFTLAEAEQLQGKELSYNNLNDTDAAWAAVTEFSDPCVVIVKHANPCGAALDKTIANAYRRAFACDSVSAFGGIVAANRTIDEEAAKAIGHVFCEVVIAPDFSYEARRFFATKPNLRLLQTGGLPDPNRGVLEFKSLGGGFLIQERDHGLIDKAELQIVTKRLPNDRERRDLLFAFQIAKHVKSNAIVYAKDGATVGIGAGQMSRVDSSRIASWKAREAATIAGEKESWTKGSVAASDAFFPFKDALVAIAEAGATSVIQPGGSIRDQEIIDCANDLGLSMVLTGRRHFRH